MGLVSFGAYTTIRLRATYINQKQIEQLTAQLAATHAQCASDKAILMRGIVGLEQSVYGQATAEPVERRVIVTPAWFINREKRLLDRLDSLERWRLDHMNREH